MSKNIRTMIFLLALTIPPLGCEAILRWIEKSTYSPPTIENKEITIDATAYNWENVDIGEYPHWCQGELPLPETWSQAEAFTIVFKDNRVTIFSLTESDLAIIALYPSELMETFFTNFEGYVLDYGDMLSLFLRGTGLSYDVLNCGNVIHLSLAKG